MFINKTVSIESAYQEKKYTLLINSWLKVGKLGQVMRSWKCTSNDLYVGVCQWQNGKCVYVSVSEWVCVITLALF